jgi:vacuolar-type H+-ATPase subunit F/Vma7
VGTVVAIGGTHELDGFALAGARVVRARSDIEVLRAWADLSPDAGLVILSSAAARTLHEQLAEQPDVLTAVLP